MFYTQEIITQCEVARHWLETMGSRRELKRHIPGTFHAENQLLHARCGEQSDSVGNTNTRSWHRPSRAIKSRMSERIPFTVMIHLSAFSKNKRPPVRNPHRTAVLSGCIWIYWTTRRLSVQQMRQLNLLAYQLKWKYASSLQTTFLEKRLHASCLVKIYSTNRVLFV